MALIQRLNFKLLLIGNQPAVPKIREKYENRSLMLNLTSDGTQCEWACVAENAGAPTFRPILTIS